MFDQVRKWFDFLFVAVVLLLNVFVWQESNLVARQEKLEDLEVGTDELTALSKGMRKETSKFLLKGTEWENHLTVFFSENEVEVLFEASEE